MHKSHIPPLPTGTPKEVLDALAEYEALAVAYQAAEDGNVGDRELEAAKDADRALIAQAVRDGKPADEIGTPNYDATLKRRESYRIAEQELRQQFAAHAIHTGNVLNSYRDELIALAIPSVEAAERNYREKLEALDQARAELNRESAVLSWCQSIAPRTVPHNSGSLNRTIQVGITTAHWDEVHAALAADAARVDALVRLERKRQAQAQREQDAQDWQDRVLGQRSPVKPRGQGV